MSAAVELAEAPPKPPPWLLLGVPVSPDGRVHVAEYKSHLPDPPPKADAQTLALAVSFEGVCWLGDASDEPPMGPLVHRTKVQVDGRGRVLLNRRVRAWLAVAEARHFAVIPVPAQSGLFLVPVDDFDRRWKDHSDVAG